jgi:hypothetical protein
MIAYYSNATWHCAFRVQYNGSATLENNFIEGDGVKATPTPSLSSGVEHLFINKVDPLPPPMHSQPLHILKNFST